MLSLIAQSSLSFTARAPLAAVRMQEAAAPVVEPPTPPPLPKIKTMRVGDKTLAGDMGFDPLGIATNPDSLAWYREAEVKHARLAMLAAFGWPVSEITNFGGLLNGDGRAPSLLNGGLGNINVIYWVAVLGFAVYWEGQGLDKQFGKKDDYLPGMLGFDPLGADSESMRSAEITNGRVAMLAITAYALEEAATKAPIFPLNLLISKPVLAPAVVAAANSLGEAMSLGSDKSFDLGSFFPVPEPEPVVAAVEAVTDAVSELAAAAPAVVDAVSAVLP